MTQTSRDGHKKRAVLGLLLWLCAAAACGEDKNGPKTGSNSNWLIACVDESQCDQAGACLCGACSQSCNSDADCSDLDDARCSAGDQAAATQCGDAPPDGGLCLPRCTPGSCRAGQSCIDGGCVLAELPGVDFCAAARMPSSEDQVRADELLTLIQQDRVDGSIACSGGANIGASPPLHLDGRLVCAARVKAQDQAESGITGPVDSLGRDAPERLGLATYAYSNWWESYAFAAKTTSQAYALLLADAVSCPELGNPAYSAVGVGVVGDVFVVTLASE